MPRIRWQHVDGVNSTFLVTTFLVTVIAAPLYLFHYGLGWFQALLFLAFFAATGLSITVGYHRLFSHLSFQARWPVRLATLLFGAAAVENSVLCWAADHRRHHKFVDDEQDPYNISKGFFHAHIGWILFRSPLKVSFEEVKDLQRDPLVRWQHRHYLALVIGVGFVLPTALGWLWGGWREALGGFLLAGVARVVVVHHMTFFINSLCHTLGRQPYSSRCTARDSALMALFTFGEGYHNFHHEFQHDYRNGVKPWHFDPTKWSIWLLHQVGLVRQLRRVPEEKILRAEIAEQQRQLAERLRARALAEAEPIHSLVTSAQERLHQALANWERHKAEYRLAAEQKMEASRERVASLRREFREANKRLREAIRQWQEALRLAQAHFA